MDSELLFCESCMFLPLLVGRSYMCLKKARKWAEKMDGASGVNCDGRLVVG